jgi:hypothetical protein
LGASYNAQIEGNKVSKGNNSIFSDRREGIDRRGQDLSMPATLDLRGTCRRNRNFQAQPWWLSINYAAELVSEKLTAQNKTKKTKRPAIESMVETQG